MRKHARVCVIGTDLVTRSSRSRPDDREVLVAGAPTGWWGCSREGLGFGGSNDNYLAIPIKPFDEQFPEVKYRSGEVASTSAPFPAAPQSTTYRGGDGDPAGPARLRRGSRTTSRSPPPRQLKSFRQITSAGGGDARIAGIALLVGGVG